MRSEIFITKEKNTRMLKRKRYSRLFNITWLMVLLTIFTWQCKKDDFKGETVGVCPEVIATDPANNATNVVTGKIITVTFNETMNPQTLNTTTFTIKQGVALKGGTANISGVVTCAGAIATFTPSAELLQSTTYTGTIAKGVKDPAGNALPENYVWSFTTGNNPDVTRPTVIATDPANGATDVALNKTITATFSEAMDPLTINTSTFVLKHGTESILGVITYSGVTAVFNPTAELLPGTVYTGTITTGSKDLAGNSLLTDYIWSFTSGVGVDDTRPTVIATDPTNGATDVALNKTITATFSEAMDPSTINGLTFVLKQGANNVAGAVTYSGVTAAFKPSVDLLPNTAYTGTITTGSKDLAGNSLLTDYIWSFTTGVGVDDIRPTVISTDPADGATDVVLSKTITATFSESMEPSTINAVTFVLKHGTTSVTGAITYSGVTAVFNPTAELLPSTTYTGTITTGSTDLAGNSLLTDYIWSFTTGIAIDDIRPTVISTDPANGATDVVLGKTITATFSELMDPLTISSLTFILKHGNTSVTGVVTYSDVTASFNPTADLLPSTTYTGTITTGSKDLAGNSLLTDYNWSFTTGVGVDDVRPTVISTDPANGATDVALSKMITATFSEPMDPLSVNISTFILKNGTIIVPGSVTYSGVTGVFIPSGPLLAATTYTGTITTDAKDLAGNTIATDYVWSFTTSGVLDNIRPTIILTDPVNGASGVALSKIIRATFSEIMNPETINTTTYLLKRGETSVPGNVTYSGVIGVFTPLSDLLPNSTYTVIVTKGVTDLANNHMLLDYSWCFTTGTAIDLTRPTVISTDPANGTPDVVLTKIISATFNEVMNPTTINSSTFVLKQGTTTISGSVSYASTTAVFTPSENLVLDKTYTATIKSAVEDIAGNTMQSDYTWTFSTSNSVRPTVTSTNPVNGAIDVPLDQVVHASFSEPMDISTIGSLTFLLKLGSTNVAGTVSMVGNTAYFTPSSPLLSNKTYTATITTVARNLAGIAIASDYIWTFETVATAGPLSVNLDCAAGFAILAGATVTNTGNTIVDGDIGLSPGSAMTGFPPGIIVNGVIHINDTQANGAKLCLTAAYNDAAGRTSDVIVVSDGELGGKTLVPGLYKSAPGSFGITNSDLTLDAQGDVNAVWIFQMPSSTLTVGNGRQVILAGGAQAKNIFWQVGTSATIGTTAIMEGTIMADQSITLMTGATLNGRALARIAAVTLDSNMVNKPAGLKSKRIINKTKN